MDWQDVKTWVADKVGFDGDTSKSTSSTAISTSFDAKCQVLLRNFTGEALYLYDPSIALTLTAGDIEINTGLSAVSDFFLAQTRMFYYGGSAVQKGSLSDIEALSNQADLTAGSPSMWCELRPGVIRLDKPLPASPDDAVAGGWYRHPALTTDSGAGGDCLLDPMDLPVFASYAAVFLKEDVVSDEIGLGRLRRYDTKLYTGMLAIRGRNMARAYSGSRR